MCYSMINLTLAHVKMTPSPEGLKSAARPVILCPFQSQPTALLNAQVYALHLAVA